MFVRSTGRLLQHYGGGVSRDVVRVTKYCGWASHELQSTILLIHTEADMKSVTFIACVLTGSVAIVYLAEWVEAHRVRGHVYDG